MGKDIEKAIKSIKIAIPKNLGIKEAYYKTSGKKLEMLFIIEKKNSPIVISYVKSLANLIQKDIQDLDISTNIYIAPSKKDINKVTEASDMNSLPLNTKFNLAEVSI